MKKNLKREKRISSAKSWINTYSGNNIVKGYAKKYSVDKLCAIKELKIIGFKISEEYEKQMINSIESLKKQRNSFKSKKEYEFNEQFRIDSDDNFAMILGYTSGGFPYGVTHEEE